MFLDLIELKNQVVTTIFHGKQKHLKNTVAQLFPKPMAKHFSEQMMMEAGLGQMKRAIDLDMAAFSSLCHSYQVFLKTACEYFQTLFSANC